jgi:hypothetical protein
MLVALAAGAVASQALLRTPAAARELATAEATS